jgi:16S rRNA (cytidine1402-2'-O)-methyltransferase
MSIIPGALYVVATPIGNLQDISLRALEVLRNVDLILAEDTRHSARLLGHYGIKTALGSFHDHSDRKRTEDIIQRLLGGAALALISDAGTPLISDPGYPLVNIALAQGIRVVPVPGPSALISALSVAGLPTEKFVFEGFLSAKKNSRRRSLQELALESRTQVFYEAPHRICRLLEDMVQCYGPQRSATLAKELTKMHETLRKDSLENLLRWLQEDDARQKGEFVLIVAGEIESVQEDGELERILRVLLRNMSAREAVTMAAEILQVPRNKLYKLAIKLGIGDS